MLTVYNVGVERVVKVHKMLKQFLRWRQNSVFEGELTDAQIEKVKNALGLIIDNEINSILLY